MKPAALSRSCRFNRVASSARRALLWLVTAGVVLGSSPGAKSQSTVTLTVLHSFDGSANGFFPGSPPVEGTDGNFYGTTQGGASSPSTIYRITPSGTLTNLHTFSAPSVIFRGSVLTRGSDGNFYGTTVHDGANGYGTVFQITPAGVFTDLHDFTAAEGYQGYGALLQGKDGNFYGTNYYGGANGYGTVYQVTLAGALTVLVDFDETANFSYPNTGLVQDGDGNFYCVLALGRNNDLASAVVQIPPAGGTPTFLYYVPEGNGGSVYQAALTQGIDGNFYGTTAALLQQTAYASPGTVFRINPFGTFQTLYRFGGGTDGSNPIGSLVQGQDGNIYGTTRGTVLEGGTNSVSTVFEVTTGGMFATLYTFAGEDGEGANGLTQGSDGSFYGTNTYGGVNNGGTIFKLTVTPHPAFFSGQVSLGSGVYYLAFANGNYFGYYTFLSDPNYLYHYDLGFEYVFDANDGKAGVYLYDFASEDFFYTSPTFPFPFLYDFNLGTVLYYYPDPKNAGHYNTDGVRYFYDFATGKVITK